VREILLFFIQETENQAKFKYDKSQAIIGKGVLLLPKNNLKTRLNIGKRNTPLFPPKYR
jgi:hypothetical protein